MMMMKAVKLGWAGPGTGQEQARSIPGGPGQEQCRSRAKQGRKIAEAGKEQGRRLEGAGRAGVQQEKGRS